MKPLLVIASAALLAMSFAACGSSSPMPNKRGDSAKVITPHSGSEPVTPKRFNAGGYLAGNAKPVFKAGKAGKVAVVSIGPLVQDGTGSASLLFAYRNNTSKGIAHVDFTATARHNGHLIASGQSQGTIPAQVQPGEVGLGFIYFEDSSSMPKAGLDYQFTSETMPADTSSYNTAPLTVKEATYNGKSIVGTAKNATGKELTGPYDVEVYCFSGNKISAQSTAFSDQDGDLAPADTVSFTADLYDTKCAHFTVGVSGFFN